MNSDLLVISQYMFNVKRLLLRQSEYDCIKKVTGYLRIVKFRLSVVVYNNLNINVTGRELIRKHGEVLHVKSSKFLEMFL